MRAPTGGVTILIGFGDVIGRFANGWGFAGYNWLSQNCREAALDLVITD
jgi:hypothetical protein